MKNPIEIIQKKFNELFSNDDIIEQENLEGRIEKSLKNLKSTINKLDDDKRVIGKFFEFAEETDAKGKEKLENFFTLLRELEKELNEVQELVKINDKIKRHLFKPIQRTQRMSVVVAVVFGIVGAILKGPEFVDWVQTKFSQKAIAPTYYESRRLKDIRSYMAPQLFSKASQRIDDLADNTEDPKIEAQAKIYQVIILLNSNSSEDIDILKKIQEIDELGDAFLEGKKILLTGMYHLKKGEVKEADSFFRRIEADERYNEVLQLESYYYQMITNLQSEKFTESEKLSNSKDLISRIKDKLNFISEQFPFVDMSSGERRVIDEIEEELDKIVAEENAKKKIIEENRTEKIAEEERIRKAEEEALKREEKRKELYKKFSELRIGIIYNRFKMNEQIIANENVKSRAKRLKNQINEGFPEIKSVTGVKALESKFVNNGIGYQKDNYYYNPNNEAAALFFEEMKGKKIIQSWKFEYEKLLRDRYPQYDFIILIAR